MRTVIVTVVEQITRQTEVEVPSEVEDEQKYCLELYNKDKLELETIDSTCESFKDD